MLRERGVTNVTINPELARGFDYYTGTVFELYDTSGANARSLFGGGRYDNLLELFGGETVAAVGFGMGDVTMRDFLETHGLLPSATSATDLMLCTASPEYARDAERLADALREEGVNVAVYYGAKKIGEQVALADKKRVPFVACIGERERTGGVYALKELATSSEKTLNEKELIEYLSSVV